MKYFFLFSLFLVVAKGCGDKKNADLTVAEIGDEVTIEIGKALHIKGSDKQGFLFTSVENDSRCPTGVNCMQAGAATILVEEVNGKSQQVNIPAKIGKGSVAFDINGAKVKVLSLNPYPASGAGKIKQEDYILKVKLMEGSPNM